ncbi:MAG: flagella basal body P-ring formation protein FlgA [Terricaulis sp.]
MLRWFCVLACLIMVIMAAPAFADTPVNLRGRIEASGPAVTLGDVFDGAGAVSGRAIAPSPPPGQMISLSTTFLAAAAQSAGLSWSAPAGMTEVRVIRPGGARATLAPASTNSQANGDVAIRRGETVTISFVAPGITLSAHARALGDGAVGQSIRFLNPVSNRTVEAVVTGPGAARAETQ